MDGYGARIQYNTLKLPQDNNIICVELPARTSHVEAAVRTREELRRERRAEEAEAIKARQSAREGHAM